jgi:hypothetical protein
VLLLLVALPLVLLLAVPPPAPPLLPLELPLLVVPLEVVSLGCAPHPTAGTSAATAMKEQRRAGWRDWSKGMSRRSSRRRASAKLGPYVDRRDAGAARAAAPSTGARRRAPPGPYCAWITAALAAGTSTVIVVPDTVSGIGPAVGL